MSIRQVHECPKCGWRYAAPLLGQTVWCPNRHLGKGKRLLPPVETTIIWQSTEGTEPPSLIKEQV